VAAKDSTTVSIGGGLKAIAWNIPSLEHSSSWNIPSPGDFVLRENSNPVNDEALHLVSLKG
jgi:hypothetical protein